MHNLLEILIFTLRNFTKLPILRFFGYLMYYIYGISEPSLVKESTNSMIPKFKVGCANEDLVFVSSSDEWIAHILGEIEQLSSVWKEGRG